MCHPHRVRDLRTVHIRSKRHEFLDQRLIAALDVLHLLDLGHTLGGQTRNDHRRACTQVVRTHRRALEFLHALDDGDLAVHMDVRTHAGQFLGISVTAVPHALGDDARTLCQAERGRHLRLHVGREAGIRHGLDIGPGQPPLAAHQHRVVKLGHLNVHLLELCRDALQMFGDDVLNQHRAAAGCDRSHKGARLNLVRNDGVAAAVQALDAADLDYIRARSLNVCPHRVQEVRQVHDMRLLGAVFHNGLALGEHRGEHDVHGRADRYHVKVDMRAVQPVLGSLRADIAALGQGNGCPERLKALDVLVDRAHAAEVAAAGHSDLGKAVFAEEHTEQIIGGAQLALQLVRLKTRMAAVLDLDRRRIDEADLCAQLAHDLKLEGHIDNLGYILDADRAVRQQGCRDDGDRCVFRP